MSDILDRRDFLARFSAFPVIISAFGGRRPQSRAAMTVYKSPTCGCCTKWVDHVKDAGFKVSIKDVTDMDAIKRDLGVPAQLASCHTAVVGPYVLEGHVPADAIEKLLADKPARARGLAVPGMPVGSPGMEVPGRAADRYEVMLFTTDGKASVFSVRTGAEVLTRTAPRGPVRPSAVGRPLHTGDRTGAVTLPGLDPLRRGTE